MRVKHRLHHWSLAVPRATANAASFTDLGQPLQRLARPSTMSIMRDVREARGQKPPLTVQQVGLRMRIASLVVAGSVAACALAGCGSMAMSGSTSSTSSVPAERGVRFVDATLALDRTVPPTPAGPRVRVSGAVVSGSGAVVDAGAIEAHVLDGPPGHAKYAVATIDVHDGAFAKSFTVVGPGGNVLRLDYVEDGKVLASTVVKGLN